MITIKFASAKLATVPAGAPLGSHISHHIIVDERDRLSENWETYERATIRPKLLSGYQRLLYYPSFEAVSLLRDVVGLALPQEAPLADWERAIEKRNRELSIGPTFNPSGVQEIDIELLAQRVAAILQER